MKVVNLSWWDVCEIRINKFINIAQMLIIDEIYLIYKFILKKIIKIIHAYLNLIYTYLYLNNISNK